MRFHFSRHLCRLALLVAAAAAGFGSGPAAADVGDVLKNIDRDGQARVLVRMKADGGGAAAWTPRLSVSRQRVAVATAFNEAAPALDRARVGALRHFRTIPYIAATVTREQAMALAAEDAVEGIYLIRRERRMEAVEPDPDPAAPPQGLNLTGAQLSIDLGSAWERGLDGAGTAIAVIDSGINFAHPALTGKNVGDACFSNTFGATTLAQCPSGHSPQIGAGAASYCPEGSNRCDHGTHVASVAAGNDGTAFGVARGANIVPVDVFSLVTDPAECYPDPAPCVLTDSLAVLNALDYVNEQAFALSIAAVNLSIGGSTRDGYCDDDPRKAVIDMLRQKGIAVAVAASNGGLTGQITTPACISSAIGVGATDDGTNVSAFSNFAATLDLMAPGLSITGAKGSGHGYGTRSGTSMSAPQVAGAFAILRQAFPSLSVDAMEAALKQTGAGVTRGDTGISVPSIKIGAALDELQGVNRRLFNNIVAIDSPQGQSMLRFYNPTDAIGNVRVTLRDAATGAHVGNWISPPIPAHASLQFTAGSIQAAATISGFPMPPSPRPYLNFDVRSTFKGSAQHVLWNEYDEVLSNLTNCGAAHPTNTAKHLMNVHSSLFAGFPSRIRIVNTGVAAAAAKLSLFNAGTGALIAEWISAPIESAASLEVTMSALEALLGLPPDILADGNGYYNVTLDGFSGYLQHLVENVRPGALLDMTTKCDIAVSGVGG